jgi:beta-N-acetylhexosaminidase
MTRDIAAVGDHFLLGLQQAPFLVEKDRALLRDLRPAGVVLFKPNFRQEAPYAEWLDSHRRLMSDVAEEIGRERFLVAIDHEGGRVIRTPPPLTRFAYAARWADRAGAVGAAMGRELASIGVNLSFAPVLDVHSNPANPVIGERAFGTTPAAVAAAALEFAAALQREGVAACGKHFPGHGDTSTDSHYELPVVDRPLAELETREFAPFAAAVSAGLEVMMTSHIVFPQIDPDAPATLSRRILTGILREEMGFGGLVVTDDLGMRAVSGLFDDPAAAPRALNAGCDILTVCAHWTDTDRCRGFAAAILDAEREGALDRHEMAASRARIRAFVAARPVHPVRELPAELLAAHARLAPLHAMATSAVTV